ncbi:MAG: SMI1/KNR4 family protein [Proteobacteria bacterium]|nr:SMI1/KNR4 family protein [Pseudomonadota bacterium]MCP4915949.1 SMI1/KNR4 family protein [Pseudomonadota bacterium]
MRLDLRAGPRLDIDALRGRDLSRWRKLPPELRAFLADRNGGVMQGSEIVRYPTPCGPAILGEIWCFLPLEARPPELPTSMLHAHEEHRDYGFLPPGILAFARCVNESLACLSVRKDSYGQVFHWEITWQEPEHGDLFVERLSAVERRYPDMRRVLDDPRHRDHDDLLEALAMATLIPVAGSFTQWLDSLTTEEPPESDG